MEKNKWTVFFKDKKTEEWKRLRVEFTETDRYVADISEPIFAKWKVESATVCKTNNEVWKWVAEHYGTPLDIYELKNNEMVAIGRIAR